MKNLILNLTLLVAFVAPSTQAFELVTNLMTTHTFESTYKDKKTGERVRYNEDNRMFSVWYDIDTSSDSKPLPEGTKFKYGFGIFKDSFYNTGPIAGVVLEPRLKQYSIKGVGSFETYYGFGAIMTTTYESMSYMPILITHVGIRTEKWFANVGAYGMGAALTANIGLSFK